MPTKDKERKDLRSSNPVKKKEQRIENFILHLLEERYVHSLSREIYEKIACLWHLDDDIEKQISSICAKIVWGHFCIEFLSHFHRILKNKQEITKGLKAHDLSQVDMIEDIKRRLSGEKEWCRLLKEELLPLLSNLMDKIDPGNLDDLTRMAHMGDYLLDSIRDMEESKSSEYTLWLESLPYMYEKDMIYTGIIRAHEKRATIPLYERLANMKTLLPPEYKGKSLPVQISTRKIRQPYLRVRHLKGGFYPCKTSAFTQSI